MTAPDELVNQKVCSKCRITKSITEFNFRNLAKNIKLSYCRECGKELTRNHYKRNKRQYTEKNLRSFKKRREFARKIKERPCADCGIQYPFYVMDFDHREDETKEFALNSLTRVTMKALLSEIAKCDVVCANCHRERTYQRILRQNEKE
jgi:hypothetical protein